MRPSASLARAASTFAGDAHGLDLGLHFALNLGGEDFADPPAEQAPGSGIEEFGGGGIDVEDLQRDGVGEHDRFARQMEEDAVSRVRGAQAQEVFVREALGFHEPLLQLRDVAEIAPGGDSRAPFGAKRRVEKRNFSAVRQPVIDFELARQGAVGRGREHVGDLRLAFKRDDFRQATADERVCGNRRHIARQVHDDPFAVDNDHHVGGSGEHLRDGLARKRVVNFPWSQKTGHSQDSNQGSGVQIQRRFCDILQLCR